jgi:hypothetical protein
MNGIKFKSAVKAAFAAAAMFAAPIAVASVPLSAADAAAGSSVLMPGETLYAGQSLIDGPYTMAMQADGNFVLYNGNQPLWQSGTSGHSNAWVIMQTDGNLVVYTPGPEVSPLWQSGTYNQPGDHLVMQSDGNAVIYTPSNAAPWATNTVQNALSSRESRAVAWELAHAHDQNYYQTGYSWDGWCETAVEMAYGTIYRYGSARIDYLTQLNAGQIHTGTNAPAGALVFFRGSDPRTGHVGLAYGDGQHYYTTDYGVIGVAPLSEGLGYLGWAYAPTSWPGA